MRSPQPDSTRLLGACHGREPGRTFIVTSTPRGRIPGLAKQAEGLGYQAVWVAKDCFAYGGFTAVLALQAPPGVKVGSASLPLSRGIPQ